MNRPSIKSIDDLRALIGPSMRVPPHLVGTFDIDKIIERDRLEELKKPLLKALTKLGNMPGVSNKNKPALVDWLVEHPEPVDQTVGSSKEEAAEAQAFFDDLEREEEYDMMMEEMADSEDETDTDDDMGWGDNEYDREAAADNEEAAAYDKQLRQLEREDELEGSSGDSEDGTDDDEDDDEDENEGQNKGAPDAGRNRKRHSVGSVHSQERATKRTRQEAESRERETKKDEIMAKERREWARKEAEWAGRERELGRELGRLTREMVETSKGVPTPLRAE